MIRLVCNWVQQRRGSIPMAHLRVYKLCDHAAGALERLRIAISLQHKLVDVACAVFYPCQIAGYKLQQTSSIFFPTSGWSARTK